jgi:hypothetical protein
VLTGGQVHLDLVGAVHPEPVEGLIGQQQAAERILPPRQNETAGRPAGQEGRVWRNDRGGQEQGEQGRVQHRIGMERARDHQETVRRRVVQRRGQKAGDEQAIVGRLGDHDTQT